ncbi:MAG: Dam family site-specific DNA-(adenine-N6)-methyltransferase, partial [Gammaproteobacteria bacterium]
RLVEPIYGSGAVFYTTDYKEYLITDLNSALELFYRALAKRKRRFIDECAALFKATNNRESAFYELRTEFNETRDRDRKAALFLYLNKHAYNGLCRYNSSGEFNVPFGSFKKPKFPREAMAFFIDRQPITEIRNLDFEEIMNLAVTGDVIYCDPPYVPLSSTAKFTDYRAGGFSIEEHERLARAARKVAKRGIPVLISNHCTDFTLEIYGDAELDCFEVRRSISCNGENRTPVRELLALFHNAATTKTRTKPG